MVTVHKVLIITTTQVPTGTNLHQITPIQEQVPVNGILPVI